MSAVIVNRSQSCENEKKVQDTSKFNALDDIYKGPR